ncbi:MAG: hypothetical protein DWH76_01955 [Planctomycetota bacterium]|jgi:hypothetical protein|nr:MAG: hypothetical protein DWH76_01955 [Planctomycetota bacterium]
MARSLNIQHKTRILFLTFVCVAGTVAASVVSRPSGATSSDGSSNSFVGTGVPWWKKSVSHTVQEEWIFAQHMSTEYGPRWRTALPDKTVLKLYQQFCAGQQKP